MGNTALIHYVSGHEADVGGRGAGGRRGERGRWTQGGEGPVDVGGRGAGGRRGERGRWM